jgi:hypothetical protein
MYQEGDRGTEVQIFAVIFFNDILFGILLEGKK